MHFIPEKDIVIVGAARTPIGGRDGILKDYSATDLGTIAIRAALERGGISGDDVSEVILGNVVAAGLGMALAKKTSVNAGIPQRVPATMVNAVCSSGMASVWQAVLAISLDVDDVVVAGGMESRTNAPYLLNAHDAKGKRLHGQLDGARVNFRTKGGSEAPEAYADLMKHLQEAGFNDANVVDGLSCPFATGTVQNDYAIAYAKANDYAVEEIDEYAYDSYRKAHEAWERGLFDDEIAPVDDVKKDQLLSRDLWERLRGTSTSPSSAYNTPGLGDAAAALVLTTRERAKELGVKPLVRVMGLARYECGPADFVEAPERAVAELVEALTKAGRPADFPIIEANESFGLQLVRFNRVWPDSLINVHGGTVALRHPLGAAGARILTTLTHAMRRYHHPRGLGVICFGGAGAFATALELPGE